jgi:hypothetical protein
VNVKELSAISSTLAPVIRDVVTREVAAQVKSVVPVVGPAGPAGPQGERGADGVGIVGPEGPAGKDAVVDLDALALKAAELIRVPVDGKDGRDGADAPAIDLDALALKAATLIPTPQDGRDGVDGKDVDIDAVVALVLEKATALIEKTATALATKMVDEAVTKAVADAVAKIPAPMHGKDGLDGKDGAPGRDGMPGVPGLQGEKGLDGRDGVDGLGFDDMTIEHDGERTVLIKAKRGDRAKTLGAVTFPVQIYRGVYTEGKSYERGDSVTWAGSMWVAHEDTSAKPGEGSKSWQLCVKKGRDGRDGQMTVAPSIPVVSVKR